MFRNRYSTWDGTRPARLDADKLFERLSAYLSETDDLGEALDRMLREGFEDQSFRIAGIDELIQQVRDEIQDLYDRYNLNAALADHRELLADIVDAERMESEEDPPPDDLPTDLPAAIESLSEHRFRSSDARDGYERLKEDADDIRRVSSFIQQQGKLFRGRERLGFYETLELIERLEALKKLQQALASRDFDSLDPGEIAGLLGEDAAANIRQLGEMLSMLIEAGYVRSRGDRVVLSPQGARRLGQLALQEIHRSLVHDAAGRHETSRRGLLESDTEQAKPYEYGDPMNVDVGASMRRALRRGVSVPIRLDPGDLEVAEARHSTRSATVLLLDMSWSMSWEGRFAAAKKVALAMDCLMRTRHPRDFFAIVGFYTRAIRIRPHELAEVTWNMGDPFTNLQDGLRMGGDLLARERAANKSMIVITDGQPTAYFADGQLFCEWPMSLGGLSTRATVETLAEVERVTRRNIVINTFMLDDSPPLRSFVEKMTRMNRGRAFYTTPGELGKFLLVDHIGRRRKVI